VYKLCKTSCYAVNDQVRRLSPQMAWIYARDHGQQAVGRAWKAGATASGSTATKMIPRKLTALLKEATDIHAVFHIVWCALNQRAREHVSNRDTLEIIEQAVGIGLAMTQRKTFGSKKTARPRRERSRSKRIATTR